MTDFRDISDSGPNHVLRLRWYRSTVDTFFEGETGAIALNVLRLSLAVEAAAKRLAPVRTGRLRSSITHRVERRGRVVVGTVGTDVHYAPYLEFGTRRMRARPYLRPALAAAVSGVL